jgi:hypothetical protein
MHHAYTKNWFDRMGLVSLLDTINASILCHEPPDAERHVHVLWEDGRSDPASCPIRSKTASRGTPDCTTKAAFYRVSAYRPHRGWTCSVTKDISTKRNASALQRTLRLRQ